MKYTTNDQWKPVNGYEDLYEVSNTGRVRSLDRVVFLKNRWGGNSKHTYKGRELSLQIAPNGYVHIDLHREGTTTRVLVHRLVCEHFLDRIDGKDYVNHKNRDTSDNRVENLEWCTQSENIQYAYDGGTKTPPHEKTVHMISEDGKSKRVFKSLKEAERQTGVKCANISKVCRGLRSHAGGYRWTYAS